jgi:hypothetical protein
LAGLARSAKAARAQRRGRAIEIGNAAWYDMKAVHRDLVRALRGELDALELLDVLKEVDFLTGFTEEFRSVAAPGGHLVGRASLAGWTVRPPDQHGPRAHRQRLAEGGGHVDTEAELRNVRHRFLNRETLRRAIAPVASAMFEARSAQLRGSGTACASDSKKFGSWSSNLMTESHARYRGPG